MACPKCGFKTKRMEEEGRKELNTKATRDVSLKVMDGGSVEALPMQEWNCVLVDAQNKVC